MRVPYRALDDVLSAWLRQIGRAFNRSRLMLDFGSLNVVSAYKGFEDLYSRLANINRARYFEIAEKAYEDAYNEAQAAGFVGEKEGVSSALVLALLAGYDGVTKYVYDHEVERKRSRLAESVIADAQNQLSQEVIKDYRRAESLWIGQTKQYGIAVEDSSVRKAYKDAGVQRVKWVTAEDERVCPACAGLDGNIYEIDSVPQKPHYNCRCYITLAGVNDGTDRG